MLITQEINTACPSFTVQKPHWTQESLSREWTRRGLSELKCFKNAGVMLRDSLAQCQHQEILEKKERIQVQAQTLQTALQLTNTQIFHCPMGPAAAWVIPKAGERGSFLLCSVVPSCSSQKDPEGEITQPHTGRWRMCFKCNDLFCSLILCTSNKTKLQGQQVSF